ncbi:DUF3810 domain-containing protein [Pedobacter antarcticus]|uniref:DUF3810 domain-containing protein n=1 Tax=Pedobacter antarcticus TaxID=34086 RepID=UPI0029314C89|nr:DUF3810 domain-containing protein [Pedobacter antarcticus]
MRTWVRHELRWLALPVLLSAIIWCIGLNSSLTEKFYSLGFYPGLSAILRWLSGKVSFAAGDFIYLFLVGILCVSLLRFIRKSWRDRPDKTHLYKAPFKAFKLILWLYIAFKILWGLNYSRPSVASTLGISKQGYTADQLTTLGEQLIREVNTLSAELDQQKARKAYTVKELQHGATTAYKNLAARNPLFTYKNPVVKAVLSQGLINRIGLEGYYCPVSGEANVNMGLPPVSLPFVTCHEISHQLGIAREDEANLAGYLACLNSPDLNFRYAGVYSILRNVLFEIRLIAPEKLEELRNQINPATQADYRAEQEFWQKYNGDMSAYMGSALDQFLKINNQTKGVDSYQDIVIWVYNLQLKDAPALFPAFENSTGYRHKNQ